MVPTYTLYFGNLPPDVDWEQLRDLVREFVGDSAVDRAFVQAGADGSRSGWVLIRGLQDLYRAQKNLNNYNWKGQTIAATVNEIYAQTPSPASSLASSHSRSPTEQYRSTAGVSNTRQHATPEANQATNEIYSYGRTNDSNYTRGGSTQNSSSPPSGNVQIAHLSPVRSYQYTRQIDYTLRPSPYSTIYLSSPPYSNPAYSTPAIAATESLASNRGFYRTERRIIHISNGVNNEQDVRNEVERAIARFCPPASRSSSSHDHIECIKPNTHHRGGKFWLVTLSSYELAKKVIEYMDDRVPGSRRGHSVKIKMKVKFAKETALASGVRDKEDPLVERPGERQEERRNERRGETQHESDEREERNVMYERYERDDRDDREERDDRNERYEMYETDDKDNRDERDERDERNERDPETRVEGSSTRKAKGKQKGRDTPLILDGSTQREVSKGGPTERSKTGNKKQENSKASGSGNGGKKHGHGHSSKDRDKDKHSKGEGSGSGKKGHK